VLIFPLLKEGTILEGGAAVATEGLSIIVLSPKDRFLFDKDTCDTAVAETDEEFAIAGGKIQESAFTRRPGVYRKRLYEV